MSPTCPACAGYHYTSRFGFCPECYGCQGCDGSGRFHDGRPCVCPLGGRPFTLARLEAWETRRNGTRSRERIRQDLERDRRQLAELIREGL